MHNETATNCLNCATALEMSYCPNCGQKSTTHRYSIRHFAEHDLVHGVWHVDKGILFTLKQLFTRPGHAVREYIQGKRANYFSYVTLILLILTITALLTPYASIKVTDLLPSSSSTAMNSFKEYTTKYPKVVVIILIPVNAIFSYLWFRKARLNFSEHLVANSYKACFDLILGLAFTILTVFYTDKQILSQIYYMVVQPAVYVYTIIYYYQFFSAYNYSKTALVTRSFMTMLSVIFFFMLVGAVWAIMEMQSQHP